MALRDWSRTRIAPIWAVGLLCQLVLLAGVAVYSRATEPPHFHALRLKTDSLRHADDARNDSVARGLRPPPSELTADEKAAMRAILRDSLGITWESHGQTTTVHLPPEVDSALARVVRGSSGSVGRAVMWSLAMFFAIPAALLALTLAWIISRIPWRRRQIDAPAG